MASSKKLLANRANARKSTGPRSRLGSWRSSFNALKYGIFAESHLLPGEAADDYQKLVEGIDERYQPNGVAEEFFARQIARSIWQLIRLEKAEIAAVEKVKEGLESGNDDPSLYITTNELLQHVKAMDQQPPSPASTENVAPEQADQPNGTDHAGSKIANLRPGEIILRAFVDEEHNQLCVEIDRQRRAIMRDLERNCRILDDMRERRMTVSVPAVDIK